MNAVNYDLESTTCTASFTQQILVYKYNIDILYSEIAKLPPRIYQYHIT